MNDPFVLDGLEVDDTILYYWTVQSISRAIRFSAEAKQQLSVGENGYILATVSGY
jgi:hypothetical protein